MLTSGAEPPGTRSASDIAGVQAARDTDVGGALDDRASVRKHGQFIGIDGRTQREFVGSNLGERLEFAGKLGQVDGTVAFVDLDGIAAA